MTGEYDVVANCLADAIDLVKKGKKPYEGTPEKGEYLTDSFMVDEDITFELNPSVDLINYDGIVMEDE